MITDYLAVDIETTGLSPERDRIIEIGAVKYQNGEPRGEYSCLIRIGQLLPQRIVELTGITQEMLEESGISEQEAILGFLEFAEDAPVLLGHNIIFDFSFLKTAALRFGREFERCGLDTLAFARELHPELESKSLSALCGHYRIGQEQAHRAAADAISAHRLYAALCAGFPDYTFPAPALRYKPKKQEPMTPRQKKYLQDLLRHCAMEYTAEMELLTKSDASRLIDRLIFMKGRPDTSRS
ncbi:MAG: 3'-5' exonuclease [Lachnospiraceae bacterium]|nr:3'-5' exonuclease [Lachnospiraceae bacterium]